MSEKKQLVKTGKEITESIINAPNGESFIYREYKQKYLILPEGLDALEKMLKEEFTFMNNTNNIISLVFTRFKKENKI